MNRIVNAVSVVVIAAAATAACGRELDLEQVPVGSEVALTREDGGVVQGTLKEQDAATVKLETGRTVRTVPKTTIAAVQVVEPSAPLELPAEGKFREYTIPAGTALTIRLVSGLTRRPPHSTRRCLAPSRPASSWTVLPWRGAAASCRAWSARSNPPGRSKGARA